MKRFRLKYTLIVAGIYVALASITVYTVKLNYEKDLRKEFVSHLIAMTKSIQDELSETIESGNRHYLKTIARSFASLGGSYRIISYRITGEVNRDGGWGVIASILIDMDKNTGFLTDREKEILEEIYWLNDVLLKTLNNKETIAKEELKTVLSSYYRDIRELVTEK